jgi:hypothetical protein
MGLPHITITEPNSGTDIRIYPDLPAKEPTQIPQFKLGPQVTLPSPPNMRYTGAHVPMKPLPGQPGKFHYGTLTHRTQLKSLWLKFTHKRLQKELDEANYENRLPIFIMHSKELVISLISELRIRTSEKSGFPQM